MSNAGTDEYFQTVGHADLFQDADSNWWGVALFTRGGPSFHNDLVFPMGRETVLFPVSWPTEGWPTAQQVRGQMSGPLPTAVGPVTEGSGPVSGQGDEVDFEPGSQIPPHWLHWRAPFDPTAIGISSPPDQPSALRLTSSRVNLTADAQFNATHEGLTAVFRRQEHTFFNFIVDFHRGFGGTEGNEVGMASFLNQDQHVHLGIVYLHASNTTKCGAPKTLLPYFRTRAQSVRYAGGPEPMTIPVPSEWTDRIIRLRLSPRNDSHFEFFAALADEPSEERSLFLYTMALLSGDGAGTGTQLGVYSTTNGGNHTFDGYVSRWRYTPLAQKIDYDQILQAPGL